uniref:Uncharacterized protein n=1 Tax=Aureoumbra lagunensis TaxID=44058 RepID=A0A7S3JXH1_9STRA|mmetsp:Transcript_11214/g.16827  ORF Transcript_11214/g.16827 Transcript_11214/m.16827 type:complete len:161 (-) Transcript_11214:570-1052(-)
MAETFTPRQHRINIREAMGGRWSDRYRYEREAFYFNGVLTASCCSYAIVVGIPGIAFTRRPIENYPPPSTCCGLGRRFPCHWPPRELAIGNLVAFLAEAFVVMVSIGFYITYHRWYYMSMAILNFLFALVCAIAAKEIYEPQYKLRRFLHNVLGEDAANI